MSGSAPSRSRVEHVVVGQPGQRLAPPGRVAQPADQRGERQDRRPGLQRRPLDAPDRVLAEDPAEQPADDPDGQRDGQDHARQVAGRPIDEQVRLGRAGGAGRCRAGGSPRTPAPAGRASRQVVTTPSIQSARPRLATERPRQLAGDQPEQQRERARSPRAIFSTNASPSSMPTATRHRRAFGSYRPFQNARAVAAQSKQARHVGPRNVRRRRRRRGINRERPAMTTPDPGAVAPREEAESRSRSSGRTRRPTPAAAPGCPSSSGRTGHTSARFN